MNRLYFDCSNGISGDMVLNGLAALGVPSEEIAEALKGAVSCSGCCGCGHNHDRSHDTHSHRSYIEIKEMILNSGLSDNAKQTACSIYQTIAEAEAEVHGTLLEETHFHEVGRDEAILNIMGVAFCLDRLQIKEIYCGIICDGHGFIQCSHGEIPVPVPAVMAMRKNCDYRFERVDVATELVTPSGLGTLIGIGAQYVEAMPETEACVMVEAKGKRNTGRGGLKIYMY